VYDKMRDTIIKRDVALAGDANPMLTRHGTTSEARQYSGRAVGADWVCPFSGRTDGASLRDPLRGRTERS
jgi:FPC/CPF motif-containing protein YcgG